MKPGLEVLQISTGHKGGSGLAARRLNYSLSKAGLETKFLSLGNLKFQAGLREFNISRNYLQKIMSGFITQVQKKLSGKIFFSIFTINILNSRRIKKIAPSTKTILHFHNWYNLVTQKQIFKFIQMGYSVVLTLHDERFYTGGCHYAFECEGFKLKCGNCPELDYIFKHIPKINLNRSVTQLSNSEGSINFIAPSKWILSRAKSSALLKNEKLHFIPNVSESFKSINAFENMNTQRVNRTIIIGVGSMDEKSYIKGGDVIAAIKNLVDQEKLPYKLIFLNDKFIQKDPEMRFWKEINYLLVPSRLDNSPNVIHEAKQLGIAVVGTLVGGITELLDPDFDVLIEPKDLSARNILFHLEERESRRKIVSREAMELKFFEYLNNPVKLHVDLYRKIQGERLLQN